MLGKLLKYDFRSLARIILPATLLAAATTVLGAGALKLIISVIAEGESSFVRSAVTVGLTLVVIASVLAIIAYSVVSAIFIYARFYKNFFTDEGYLTFTLPVKTHTLLLSKLISYIVWGLICMVAVVAFIAIFVLFGTAPAGSLINADAWNGFLDFLKNIYFSTPYASVMGTLSFFIQSICSGLMIFLAISIGCTVANKHKLVTSVAFYFVLNTALQIISTVFIMCIGLFYAENTVFFNAVLVNDTAAPTAFVGSLLGSSSLFYAAIAVIEFFVINHIMKKKLNLA